VTASYHIQHGDCLESLQALPDESVDSVVTDPPYGLSEHKPEDIVKALTAWLAGEQYQPRAKGGFMGRSWDRFVPGPEVWRECLRVLKPGGHLLCFAGTRTVDLMGIAVRLAGFEIRDEIQWLYGTGFPKSLDISKAIDGLIYTGRSDSLALREVNHTRPGEATVRKQTTNGHSGFVGSESKGPTLKRDTPASAEATQWAGWHTALKPAHEPIIVARKPLDGTVAENVLRHGTGGVNVDGCWISIGTVSGKPISVMWSKSNEKLLKPTCWLSIVIREIFMNKSTINIEIDVHRITYYRNLIVSAPFSFSRILQKYRTYPRFSFSVATLKHFGCDDCLIIII
jgi:site-specific DNA-methyltransferase (adenine-specific)